MEAPAHLLVELALLKLVSRRCWTMSIKSEEPLAALVYKLTQFPELCFSTVTEKPIEIG